MSQRIAVFGLGYVGLPLAVALAKHFEVVGFDIDDSRITELKSGFNRTRELEAGALQSSRLTLTNDRAACVGCSTFVVTVPTPVDRDNRPDLRALEAATRDIAEILIPGQSSLIVYESTVFPGVTEDICGRILEANGLRRGVDFKLGYSPERINPGDKVHTVDKITKVIAADDQESLDQLDAIYSKVTSGGVFRAASIKTAETAKAIENAQRDINIAFVNEVSRIVADLDVSIWDVLEAAKTKWNFLPFEPGLVGGHCIGVDPYYLSHLAESLGHHPQVILAGRETNDSMGTWIADRLHEARHSRAGSVLMLGVTFKENVPDIRNSRVIDVASRLEQLGHQVSFADPHADPKEVSEVFGHDLRDADGADFDLVVGAVPHDEYRSMEPDELLRLVNETGMIADLKAMWRSHREAFGDRYWTL